MHLVRVAEKRESGKALAIIAVTTAMLLAGAAFYTAMTSVHARPVLADTETVDPSKPDPSIEGQPNEASGEDLYQRGFYPEAIAEWKRAVEVNKDAGAAFRLGEEYLDAKVVERDIPAAVEYQTFGAKGGDMRAQLDLASFYDQGIGVEKDVRLAAIWYEAAAKQGHPSAQYNVGTMYEDGAGVPQDNVRAYMYYQLAIEGGFPRLATGAIERLSEVMAPAEIKQATLMVRSFKRQAQEESVADAKSALEAYEAGSGD
ncbi:tetratricopeptide repeat protein [Parvibaculum sp.]|uniref:tetratricopeptide repeat protein n=1 Tax=Parvibaculum sp. TaxID=2024848 RepID=UPI00391CCC98